MKVVIINGGAGVGKDLFCFLCDNFAHTYVCSSIDYVKSFARDIGWDGVTKDEKTRKFLSNIKLLCTEYNDASMKMLEHCYNFYIKRDKGNESILFMMVREVTEIAKAKEMFNAKTLFITNPRVPKITSNMADAHVDEYEYDYYINNDGTIDDLTIKARNFVETISSK